MHRDRSVYLSGPIGDLSYDESHGWRDEASEHLKAIDIRPLVPLRSEAYPQLTNFKTSRCIMSRDRFDATRCGVILVYLLGAKKVSVGTVMEVAWAEQLRTPVVVVMEEIGNPHDNHPMFNEAIDFRCTSLEQALHLIQALFQ
jgi:nucleoside 2-deoxyribosyltransferase